MAATLSTLITRVQAQLLDDGTLFSTATITAAARRALAHFNRIAPVFGAELVAVVDDQFTYELAGGSFPSVVLDVLDVLLNDDDGEEDDPLDFDRIFEDNRVYIRLRTPESSGNLLVRYTQPHTVSGLDSETESTLTTDQDQTLTDGICAYAIGVRLMLPIESVNLNLMKDIQASYQAARDHYMQAFLLGLSRYANRSIPVSEPRKTSWLSNDIRFASSSAVDQLRDL